MTPEQKKALEDYQRSVDEYVNNGPQKYGVEGQLTAEDLGPSAMEGVQTDPEYKKHEIAALRELERQSQEGFTASDRAAMARAEQDANRAQRGRLGAIQDNMRQRGMSGSGMDMVAQMQAAQDANELEAMKALEREGMMADRKSAATRQLGDMSSGLQSRDFNQAAQKAAAADRINEFNNRNRMDAQRNNLGVRQDVSNQNTSTGNQFANSSLAAQQQGAKVAYDAATEEENRRLKEKQAAEARKAAQKKAVGSTIGTVGGGVAGGIFGGPAGAMMGSQIGGQVGGGVADAYPSDKRLKEDIKSENGSAIDDFLESFDGKSYRYKGESESKHGPLADDLAKSKIGSDMLRVDEDGMKHVNIADAVGALLASVAHLNKKIGGGK